MALNIETYLIAGEYEYNPPTGYNIVDIECWGADVIFDNNHIKGGYVKARYAICVAQPLKVSVGDRGKYFKGGSNTLLKHQSASQGADGSGVRLSDDRVLIAAGGAGGTGKSENFTFYGGVGGGYDGEAPPIGGKSGSNGGAGGVVTNPLSFFMNGLDGSGVSGGDSVETLMFGQGSSGGGGGGLTGGGSGAIGLDPASAEQILIAAGGGGGGNGWTSYPGIPMFGTPISIFGDDMNRPSKVDNNLRSGQVTITAVGWCSMYSGSVETYTVKDNVDCLQIELWGADSMNTTPNQNTLGGFCRAQLNVNLGDSIEIAVGSVGSIDLAGLNPKASLDGGQPGPSAVGGGAASGVFSNSTPILIAGGAGGAGSQGGDPQFVNFGGAGGAILGYNGSTGAGGGQGGQTTTPGVGGTGQGAGSDASGSTGGKGGTGPFGGGGGGGGWAGGGGGSIENGGGGGSSYYDTSNMNLSFSRQCL